MENVTFYLREKLDQQVLINVISKILGISHNDIFIYVKFCCVDFDYMATYPVWISTYSFDKGDFKQEIEISACVPTRGNSFEQNRQLLQQISTNLNRDILIDGDWVDETLAHELILHAHQKPDVVIANHPSEYGEHGLIVNLPNDAFLKKLNYR